MVDWDVWGLLVGEKLPADWFTVGDFEAHPGDAQEIEGLLGRRFTEDVSFNPGHPTHFDVSRAPIRVATDCVVRFLVSADDLDGALAAARDRLPFYVAAFDSVAPDADKPYHVELLALGPTGDAAVAAFPATWNVYPVHAEPFTKGDSALVESRLNVLLDAAESPRLEAARIAAIVLRDATYLADTAMGVSLLENASVLLYFQVVEGISQAVRQSATAEFAEDLANERNRIASSLQTLLSDAASDAQISMAIHGADYELRQAEASHLRQRVVNAGNLLGLDEATISAAEELLTVRNRKLAHFGGQMSRDEWIRWFHQRNGRRLATSYLGGHLDWLAGE